jgi:hypothetical protein
MLSLQKVKLFPALLLGYESKGKALLIELDTEEEDVLNTDVEVSYAYGDKDFRDEPEKLDGGEIGYS